jgi:hypothetical protein
MTGALESLFISLGVKADSSELKKFTTGVDTLKKSMKIMTAVGTVAVGGLFAMSKASADSADVIGKAASKLSLNTSELQEYIYVSEQAGGSSEKFISSFKNLEIALSDAAMGNGTAVDAFKLLDIELTNSNGTLRDTQEVMLDVSDAFSKIDDTATKQNIAKKLRIDDSMITMLQGGSKALEEVRARAVALGFVKTPKMISDSETFNDNMNDSTKVIAGLTNMVNSEFIPLFSNLMKLFNDWYIANKKLIQQKLGAFIQGLMKFVKGFLFILKEFIVFVDAIAQSFGGWEFIIKGVGLALGGLMLFKVGAGLLAILPMIRTVIGAFKAFSLSAIWAQVSIFAIPIAIGLGIAAIILFANEIYTFATEGKTILEPFFKWIVSIVKDVVKAFSLIGDGLSSQWDKTIQAFTKLKDKMKAVFSELKKDVLEPFNKLKETISSGFNAVGNFFGMSSEDKTSSPIASVANNSSVSNTSTNKTVQNDVKFNVTINGNANDSTIDKLKEYIESEFMYIPEMVN